ncbi:MAG: germination protein YpeB [Clostridia bacterium]|nr:germination protein YpeB [Clostridia bacterium]
MKNILVDWKNRLKKGHMLSIICTLLIIVAILGFLLYKKQREYRQASENSYNLAFYELVGYVQNVEAYLAKSIISSTPEKSADTLTNLWREANLAQSYLSRLPIESQELENTAKFLNQVSDYSYSLSRKNIKNEQLSDEDFKNLKDLHGYSIELENTLNQLSSDLNDGRLSWEELTEKGTVAFAQQVDNISKESFSNLEENFHEYTGLIYDGAFSEHLTGIEKKGLTGEDTDENQAKVKVREFLGEDNIKEINSMGFSQNATIPIYDFSINTYDEKNINISISKKGGHVVSMNVNRDINAEAINEDEANKKGREFLESKGFNNMKETYYLKQEGIVTVNYAYVQDNVVIYPDLIKLKIALDNGEIMGIETTGYLNNHEKRDISNIKISKDRAKNKLNKNLEIQSEGLAIIPTNWKTEILCYEFKGKIDNREFLVYINAENGNEEDILIITNTPNGTLTM